MPLLIKNRAKLKFIFILQCILFVILILAGCDSQKQQPDLQRNIKNYNVLNEWKKIVKITSVKPEKASFYSLDINYDERENIQVFHLVFVEDIGEKNEENYYVVDFRNKDEIKWRKVKKAKETYISGSGLPKEYLPMDYVMNDIYQYDFDNIIKHLPQNAHLRIWNVEKSAVPIISKRLKDGKITEYYNSELSGRGWVTIELYPLEGGQSFINLFITKE